MGERKRKKERKKKELGESFWTHQLLFMLVRIYDLEPARAGGIIHIRSSQKEKASGALIDS